MPLKATVAPSGTPRTPPLVVHTTVSCATQLAASAGSWGQSSPEAMSKARAAARRPARSADGAKPVSILFLRDCLFSSAEMRFQEGDGALPRDFRALRVVAAALVAIEAVAGRIDVDLDAARMGGAQLVDVGERYGMVGLAEMRQHRAFRRLLRNRSDAAAVVDHGRAEAGKPGRRNPGEEAAPAIADDPDLSGPRDCYPGRRNVGERVLGRGLALERDAFLDVVLGIAEREARPDAVEQGRRDRQEPSAAKPSVTRLMWPLTPKISCTTTR